MSSDRTHLIERAASRLQGVDALSTLGAPPAPGAAARSPPADTPPPPARTLSGTPPGISSATSSATSSQSPAETVGETAPGASKGTSGETPHETSVDPASQHAGVSLDEFVKAGLVVGGKRSRPVEEYRIAAASILSHMPKRPTRGLPGNLLMITSPKPNEGKSFSALNLAASIAQNGLGQVLLVDIDPKIGSISTRLGLAGRTGLFDLALGAASHSEALFVPTAIAGLSILPLGTTRSLIAERGITRAVADTITAVARRTSKLLILDAPPCLATSDPTMLAADVTQIVMIAEAGRTQRRSLRAALELTRGCPVVTLMLNKARVSTTHSFGDYDYYGG